MYDNGIVSFVNPQQPGSISPGQWNAPSSIDAAGGNYFIAALWADLAPTSNTKYSTNTDGTYLKYTWTNISEYYSGGTRLSSFSTTIKPSGDVSTNYYSLHLNSTNVLAGTAGDLSLGEYMQVHSVSSGTEVQQLSAWQLTGKPDPCSSNPYYSASCAGFKEILVSAQPPDTNTQTSMSVDSSTITETPQIVAAPTATTTQTTAQNSPARTTVSAATQRVLDIVRNELQAIAGTETETVDQTQQQQSQAVVASTLAEQLVAQTITTTPILVQQTPVQATFSEASLTENTQKVTLAQELSVLPQNTPTSTADAPGNNTVAVNKAAQDSTLASSVSISAIAKQPQGFELYSQSFKDSEFYEPKAIYTLQKVVDNDRVRRLLNSANENRHQQMLQDQYK